jgi:hypothetical protein
VVGSEHCECSNVQQVDSHLQVLFDQGDLNGRDSKMDINPAEEIKKGVGIFGVDFLVGEQIGDFDIAHAFDVFHFYYLLFRLAFVYSVDEQPIFL